VKEEFNAIGSGWSWNDYQESYMVERSAFPMHGNLVTIIQDKNELVTMPKYFKKYVSHKKGTGPGIERPLGENKFYFDTLRPNRPYQLPFISRLAMTDLLNDILSKEVPVAKGVEVRDRSGWKVIYSQPLDSLLKPMMHRSDNFFAEQCLIMASNELLGKMNDVELRDSIMKTDFKDLPQKPRWADGSGLSRYNLFTPRDFIAILQKMENEFGMERIKTIFPTGGEGTISSYYKQDSGYIYAKTGTLSGVVALSGYLLTKDNRQLIFSVLVNNHQASSTDVRRAVEKFLQSVRNRY
jgi:D-alanyl-D-alanine carboxypeptidase/D-alanyl-D-alanine-endopeptidase (penicillin-binding protein 4)